jgi:cytochrome c
MMLGLISALAAPGLAAAEGDAAAGAKIFNRCKACHSLEAGENRVGPSLHGVIGRRAGSAAGYKYSEAMKLYGVVWDAESLGAYLEAPRKLVPGTKMSFPGLKKADDRANVIAYIEANAN